MSNVLTLQHNDTQSTSAGGSVVAFDRGALAAKMPGAISPELRAEAIAFLLRERDATARRLAMIDVDLAELTGRTRRNNS
jgi:hypothetical protein